MRIDFSPMNLLAGFCNSTDFTFGGRNKSATFLYKSNAMRQVKNRHDATLTSGFGRRGTTQFGSHMVLVECEEISFIFDQRIVSVEIADGSVANSSGAKR